MPASVEQISAEVFHLRIPWSTGGYAMNLTSTPAVAQSSDGITKPPDILPNSIDVFGATKRLDEAVKRPPCALLPVGCSKCCGRSTMGSVMTRLLLFTRLLVLFACWVLAAILLFQGNLAATGYQPQATSSLAQDDGGNGAKYLIVVVEPGGIEPPTS